MQENQIRSTSLEENMKESYLRYSMSVIVSRALPDVRDGLKPVHRRVLYGMHEKGVLPGKPFMKSAKIVGEVMGNYHPHGDSSIYDTLVRMAQDFSLRYPLVDGQGNFGSVDGDSPAAMRYTEARMSRFAEMVLEDLDKDTVDWVKTYDGSLDEPSVLPTAFPNLLVNGSTGIAVGMATNMAPHNLREIIAACKAVIANPEIEPEALLDIVTGPDFPTGGTICGRSGIRSAYLTGRGKVIVRAKTHTETMSNGKERIIVTEIPYMVNKSRLLETISGLIKDKKVEGITDLRDESDRKGMRIVIELRKDVYSDVILNQLYKYTQMRETFGIYNLALVKKQPRLLTLKDLISLYIEHRHEVIVRRTQFELNKAKDRAHILEGLRIAQQNTDEVVRIIRYESESQADARVRLEARFNLSEKQSEAIVAMRLGQLTALDVNKIETEYNELCITIADLEDILAKHDRRMKMIEDRLDEIEAKYGDARRTEITDSVDDIDIEDLIADEEQVITLSQGGYIKRMATDTYRSQGRGGVGVNGGNLREDDFVRNIFIASNHSYLLAFTNFGRAHWMKVYSIPETTRTGRGKPIINMIELTPGEVVSAIVPIRKFVEGEFILMCTKNGVINKMASSLFAKPRRNGVNAISLDEGDTLVNALLSDNSTNLMIASRKGQAIKFPPSAFRATGRGTRGVRGINLQADDNVIGMIELKTGTQVLTLSENGYGKRTEIEEYRETNRGGKGVRNIAITEKTGDAVAVLAAPADQDLIVTTRKGTVIRTPVESIRLCGRASQGVRVIRLRDDDAVMDLTLIDQDEEVAGAEQQIADSTEAPIEVALAPEVEEVATDIEPEAE